MNEWLNDVVAELKQAKADQKSQAERLDLFKTHTGRVFEDIKVILQDAAGKMQADPDIKQRVGQLECQFGYTDRVEINRHILPAVDLTGVAQLRLMSLAELFTTLPVLIMRIRQKA